jgi:hypothetical protein
MNSFNRLLRFPHLVAEIIAAAPDHLMRRKPAAGGFAIAEHPSHLADLEEDGYAVRIERLLAESYPLLPDFDGKRVAAERNYIELDPFQAAARFISVRTRNLERVGLLSPVEWNRTGEQQGVGEVTLRRVIEMMGEHDATHAVELVDLLRELGLAVPPELLEYERPLQESA